MAVEATVQETLLVRGLDSEAPGDIVGAFVNEAGVGPDAIGDLEIDGDEATVEVDAAVAEATARTRDYVEEYTRLVECGKVGFLNEPRRFNVALTRARRKAVVIGDANTVASAPVYEDFVEYTRDRGRVVDLAASDSEIPIARSE